MNLLSDLHYVGDAVQTVCVLEHLGLIGREVGRERAVLSAPSSLVFARSTGLACASLDRHCRVECTFIDGFDDHQSRLIGVFVLLKMMNIRYWFGLIIKKQV